MLCRHATRNLWRRPPGYSPTFEQITFWSGRMADAAKLPNLAGLRRNEKPWLDGMPRLIFVSDMGDAMCASVPFDWLRMEVVDTVVSRHGRRHCWLWLTKPGGWLSFQRGSVPMVYHGPPIFGLVRALRRHPPRIASTSCSTSARRKRSVS